MTSGVKGYRLRLIRSLATGTPIAWMSLMVANIQQSLSQTLYYQDACRYCSIGLWFSRSNLANALWIMANSKGFRLLFKC